LNVGYWILFVWILVLEFRYYLEFRYFNLEFLTYETFVVKIETLEENEKLLLSLILPKQKFLKKLKGGLYHENKIICHNYYE